MDPIALHRQVLDVFDDRVSVVAAHQWTGPTPCAEWDVRALVNHVVAGHRWAEPLLAGRRIDEVTGLNGDVLGDDPIAAARAAAGVARAAFDRPGAAGATVHASVGDFPGTEYAWQRLADTLIHAWDLAAATGGDTRLPDPLVAAATSWLDGMEEALREAGVIADPVPVPPEADAQATLLSRCGRSPAWRPA